MRLTKKMFSDNTPYFIACGNEIRDQILKNQEDAKTYWDNIQQINENLEIVTRLKKQLEELQSISYPMLYQGTITTFIKQLQRILNGDKCSTDVKNAKSS